MDWTSLAWPGALLILATLFLIMFRKEVVSLLNRTTSAKLPFGSELHTAVQQTDLEEPAGEPPPPVQSYQDVHQKVDNLLRGLDQTDSPVERGLIEAYKRVTWELYYERVYQGVYGTQLHIIQAANTSILGLGRESVEFWHREHLKVASYQVPFHSYVGFLLNTGLLTCKSVGDNEIYEITPVGKGFLVYLVGNGKSLFKPLYE